MEILSLALSSFFALASIGCFANAVLFFQKSRHKQGVAFSSLMFLCVVLAYVPRLESIKGGKVDAKFARTVGEAKDLVSTLTEMARINALATYTNLAWIGRMGAPYARDKQRILEQVDNQLDELKISANDRREISRKFIQLVAVDLGNVFHRSIETGVNLKYSKFAAAAQSAMQKDPNDPSKEKLEKLAADINEWRSVIYTPYLVEDYDLTVRMDRLASPKLLDERQLKEARNFAQKISLLFNASREKGNYTSETASFLDSFLTDDDIKKKVIEIFALSE